jgi:hypothetical protein
VSEIAPGDVLAVTQLLSAYCHIVDSSKWDRLPELFTPDAVFDATPLGLPMLEGLDTIEAAFAAADPAQRPVAHVSCTQWVEAGPDRDSARATSTWFSVSRSGVVVGGVFVDELQRTPVGWQFRRREASRRWRAAGHPPV